MMHKSFFIVLFGAALVFTGCNREKNDQSIVIGEPPKVLTDPPKVSGGMVLPVNSELITINEVISPIDEELKEIAANGDYLDFRRKARSIVEQAVSNRISNIVLYQKAKKEAREDIDEQLNKAADNEVRLFVAGFGGNYADAEKAIKKMGMNWKTFLDYQRRLLMVQAYLTEEFKDKKPVTYSELVNYYDKIKDEAFFSTPTVQFRLIDIEPGRVSTVDANQTRRARAMQLATECLARLVAGEDFASLAKQYSTDSKAQLGGLWSPVSQGSLAEPYDILEKESLKLTPGQYAGPIDVGSHVFILKLETKTQGGYQPFESVQHQVYTRLKFQRRRDAIDSMTEKLMAQADVGDKQTFVELCLQKAYQDIKNM